MKEATPRQATKAESREIQRDLDAILSLSVRGLISDVEKRKALKRWVKRHELVLLPAVLKRMGIGR